MKLNLNARDLLTGWVNVGPPRNIKENTTAQNARYFIGNWKNPSSITDNAEEIQLQGMLNDLNPQEVAIFLQDCSKILNGNLSFSFVDCRKVARSIVDGLPLDQSHQLIGSNCLIDLTLVTKVLGSLGYKNISIRQWEWGYHVTTTH